MIGWRAVNERSWRCINPRRVAQTKWALPRGSAHLRCSKREALRRRFFQDLVPLALGREAIHARAVQEGGLRRAHVIFLAAPRFLRRSLQRAAVGERHLPREAANLVHA